MSRAVESRSNSRRPILSDLRESGAIEQDADIVMFIYRPEYYGLEQFEDGVPSKGAAEIIIAKHRNGPTANVRLRFIDRFAKFEDFTGAPASADEDFNPDDPGNGIRTIPSRMNDNEDETPF